jgi:peroxiredoxin
MLEIGDRAPECALPDLRGRDHSLLDLLSESGVVLAFFKISCPVCQFTLPFLERLHREAAASSVRFYGVSQDDATDTRDFNREFGITFPTLLDEQDAYAASNAFGVSHVPSMFFVSQDRTIQWTCEGFSKKALEELALRLGVKVFHPGEFVPEFRAG